MKRKIKEYLILYISFCIMGVCMEGIYGLFWGTFGTAPWTYPGSFLCYTSLEVLPLWGFAGLMCVCVYRAIIKREASLLFPELPCLMLAAAMWINIYSILFQ